MFAMHSPEQLRARLEACERAVESSAAQGESAQALEQLLEGATLLASLRRVDVALSVELAAGLVELATCLAREDGPRYLPGLVALTEQFARSCQRCGLLGRAADSYAQAVEGAKLLALAEHADAGAQLALLELMSQRALCLAQLGRLDAARELGLRVVELGRGQLWRSLPVVSGALVFLADLEQGLGCAPGPEARLSEALELLEAAVAADQPGAQEAAAKLRARLEAAQA